MPYSNNKFSFATPSPKSRIFNFIMPRNIQEGEFFSRSGQNFQFQDTDRMGLGPYIRLVPSIALAAAVIVLLSLIITIVNYSAQLNGIEILSCAVLAVLVTGMVSACAWLLKDFSESAIIDKKHKLLWIGGGYFGRWEAIAFNEIRQITVIESDKAFTDSHYQVQLKTEDDEYIIYKDSLKDLTQQCAEELTRKLNIEVSI